MATAKSTRTKDHCAKSPATEMKKRNMSNTSGNVQAMLRDCMDKIASLLPPHNNQGESLRESLSQGKVRIHETGSFRVLEALPDGPKGEKIFKVILISEGPGNRRNKNFYGAEAVESSVSAFEGQWCYLNHQDADEADTLPERRIQDKAGYYKNLGIIDVEEGKACAGELHCDLSESGAMLADKIKSALKYKESFPNNGKEYVGFSVNADGNAETRDMTDKGGGPDDNYVTAITEGDSCDLVTTPARGGRGLAVIREDKAGAVHTKSKEERMKKLQVVFAKFMESLKGVNDAKVKQSANDLAKAFKEAEGGTATEAEASEWAKQSEGESAEDHLKRLHGMAKAISGHLGKSAGSAGSEDESEVEPAADASEPAEKKDDADSQESKRDAIAGLIRESGMPKDYYSREDIARFAGMKYSEAKREINKDAKLAKSIRESIGGSVASLHRGVSENNNDTTAAFCEAARRED